MGLFARFRQDVEPSMSPQIALAGLLLAVSGSKPNDAEQNFIGKVLTGPGSDHNLVDNSTLKALLQDATRMLEKYNLTEFLHECLPILSMNQRKAILINIMDLCLVDGSVMEGERHAFESIRESFGISNNELRPYADMLAIKNDPSIRLSVMEPRFSQAAEAFRSLV